MVARRIEATNETSPLSPIMEKFVRDEWTKLESSQITPWAFFNSGQPMRVKDFYGRDISYQGIRFEGSPQLVFWSRYIEPFLEDLAFRAVDLALKTSRERGIDSRAALRTTQGLLVSYVRKTFERMADVDRRLRGRGFPENVQRRGIEREARAMEEFVNARINAELAVPQPPKSRWKTMNTWFREHPLFPFITATALTLAGILAKVFGWW